MPGYKQEIIDAIRDEARFVRATFSGATPDAAVPWTRVTVRPVSIKGDRHAQFAYFDAKKCITKNYRGDDVAEQAAQLLSLPFHNVSVESTAAKIQLQITAKGKVLIHRGKASNPQLQPDLAHDRQKHLTLPANSPDPFLTEVGIMTSEGKIRADRQRKFRQINEFLKIVEQTIEQAGGLEAFAGPELSVVDCGCGNAYLTFATYHYFREIHGVPVTLTGIDVNAELLKGHEEKIQHLGWTALRFESTPIIAFTPEHAPDIVLALHACDTATDEALAQAIKWGSRLIFSVPCCHHHLQQQLDRQGIDQAQRPLLRHGVLAERLGDILTDNFRALILRILGYQADVMEFVESEHTAKNLLIRAVKRSRPVDKAALREYVELKRAWQVTPYLEELLREELATLAPADQEQDAGKQLQQAVASDS